MSKSKDSNDLDNNELTEKEFSVLIFDIFELALNNLIIRFN